MQIRRVDRSLRRSWKNVTLCLILINISDRYFDSNFQITSIYQNSNLFTKKIVTMPLKFCLKRRPNIPTPLEWTTCCMSNGIYITGACYAGRLFFRVSSILHKNRLCCPYRFDPRLNIVGKWFMVDENIT